MANHASALKAHRQSLKRRVRNRGNTKFLRSALKKFNERVETAAAAVPKEELSALYSKIDKAARKKALSRNAAARQKSRLTKKLAAARQAAPQD